MIYRHSCHNCHSAKPCRERLVTAVTVVTVVTIEGGGGECCESSLTAKPIYRHKHISKSRHQFCSPNNGARKVLLNLRTDDKLLLGILHLSGHFTRPIINLLALW